MDRKIRLQIIAFALLAACLAWCGRDGVRAQTPKPSPTIPSSSVGAVTYSQSFTGQTSVAVTHNFGTTAVTVACYDTSTPPLLIVPNTVALTNSNTATVTFANSQSGTCVVK